MKLLKLTLHNFKGIADFVLEPNGADLNIHGKNAAGKTSLFDAESWLFFDKDSDGKQRNPKMTDNDGNSMGLDADVEAVLEIDGATVTLRKVQKEDWVKPRGKAHAEMKGHKVEYFVNEVPKSKRDYDTAVSNMIDEGLFKLLANPKHFNEGIKWPEKREILMALCPALTDADIIYGNPALQEIPSLIGNLVGNKRVDDLMAILKLKRGKVSSERKGIPERIDEAKRTLPAAYEGDIEAEITELKNTREEAERDKVKITTGGLLGGKKFELTKIENLITKEGFNQDGARDNKARSIQSQISDLKVAVHKSENKIKTSEQEIATLEGLNTQWRKDKDNLRIDYDAIKASVYSTESCSKCGQELPENQRQSEEEFNGVKSRNLEKIGAQGRAMKAQITEREDRIADHKEAIMQYEESKIGDLDDIRKLEEEIDNTDDVKIDTTTIDGLRKSRTDLELEIRNLEGKNADEVAKYNQIILEIDDELSEKNMILAAQTNAVKTRERIDSLGASEKVLAKELERIEGEIFQLEEFERAKINLLEGQINDKFKYAKFRMFKQQLNEGSTPTCETTLNGKAYDDLSNSEQINIGLDIINTLSKFYGVVAPIFVDNAEAVSDVLPTEGQQIRLYVSKPDKVLRIE